MIYFLSLLLSSFTLQAQVKQGHISDVFRSDKHISAEKTQPNFQSIIQAKDHRIIVFWDLDCPFCKQLWIDLNKLKTQNIVKKIKIIGIISRNEEYKTQTKFNSAIQNYKKKYKLDFPVYYSPKNKSIRRADVATIPEVRIFDKNGNLQQKTFGNGDAYRAIVKYLYTQVIFEK